MPNIPLAERLRPRTIDEYIGQEHLVGKNGVFRKFFETGNVPSFILWGPPGVGKTTLAKIVATQLERPFFTLSAVTSGVKDVREVIESARKQRFFDQKALPLFIDEIHRFNKSQQDSLLGAVEQGVFTLIGATTENPSFEVISPLLSRCQVYILKSLEDKDLQTLLDRALTTDTELKERDIEVTETGALFRFSGGDARKPLNILEIVVGATDGKVTITDRYVTDCLQQNIALYDKNGEQHYDVISAFIKSVRGSDPNAAIYYLARMLAGGEEPRFLARRLVILASEDIGLANPNALLLANACFDTVHKIGMPEARITLAETTIYLATSPKSNSAYMAINKAMSLVERDTTNRPVPLHLRNAPTRLMDKAGYGKRAINTPTTTPDTSPSRSSCPRAFRARSSTNPTRRTPPRPKSPNGWRSCGKTSTNETHRHYIRHPRNLRRHAPRISERRGRNLACGRHRLDRAGRPDRRIQAAPRRERQHRRRHDPPRLSRVPGLRVRAGAGADDPHRRLSPPLRPARRAENPVRAPETLHRRAFPHPQSHLRSRLRPAPCQPRSRRGSSASTRSARPYALRSTARRCATWRSASGPATENPAGGELKPTVRESLFRHKITRNKILYPKRPEMHSGRISVIVSEISETFRQVAS